MSHGDFSRMTIITRRSTLALPLVLLAAPVGADRSIDEIDALDWDFSIPGYFGRKVAKGDALKVISDAFERQSWYSLTATHHRLFARIQSTQDEARFYDFTTFTCTARHDEVEGRRFLKEVRNYFRTWAGDPPLPYGVFSIKATYWKRVGGHMQDLALGRKRPA